MMDLWVSDSLLHAVEQAILGLLIVLGIACVAVFCWRWFRVKNVKRQAMQWREILVQDLTGQGFTDGEWAHKKGLSPGERSQPSERETSDGTREARTNPAHRLAKLGLDNAFLAPEALEKLLETQAIREKKGLEIGAQFLGTVGANAPFLGLTGTVLGILAAFRQMAAQGGGSGGPEVMAAIAGALIATAAGLIVAIPAVVLYNLLKSSIRDTLDALAEIRGLLLARSFHAAAEEVV